MKKLLFVMFISFLANVSGIYAQPGGNWTDKISWSFNVEKIDDSHAYIVATAKLKEHWHVYSVTHDPAKAEFTGVPTSFSFEGNSNYKLIGKTVDGVKPKTVNDDLGTHFYFENKAVFKQKIEVLTDKSFEIQFSYAFQVCDENGCLFPPDQEAKINIQGFHPSATETKVEKIATKDLIISGDEAKDKEGNNYVLHKDEWVIVPEGNSVKFYKKYLKLKAKNEK